MEKGRKKVILRFMDGGVIRGHVSSINPERDIIPLRTKEGERRIHLSEFKAIYFVKTFKGDRAYQEKKIYGLTRLKYRR